MWDYFSKTPAKQQAKDFVNTATDLRSYEAPAQLLLVHKLAIAENPITKTSATTEASSAIKELPNPYSRFYRFETKYGEHAKTFGTSGNMSRGAYYNRAIKLADAQIGDDILGFTSEGNTTFKLNRKTGEFIVINPEGLISSFYRRVNDPVNYLETQKAKYGVKKTK